MKREQNTYEEPRCKVIEIQTKNVIATSVESIDGTSISGLGLGDEETW